MLFISPNPEEVPLQIVAQNINGTPKLDIVTATVRVYLLSSEGETELLTPTSLTGTDATWRYIWEPESLVVGQYIIEYSLIDSEGLSCVSTEDLVVIDVSGGSGSGGWDDLRIDHNLDGSMGEVMTEIWKVIYKMRYGNRYKNP